MKQVLVILMIIVGTLFLSGCVDDLFCDSGPYYADLKVKVTINEQNPQVPITVFLGRFEKRDTLFTEWVTESTLFYEMEGGFYYTAAALYTSGARQILAIDGKRMEITESDDECPSASNITLRLGLAD